MRHAGTFTIVDDPEQGGCWFDVPPVDGDVSAKTVLSFDDDGTGVHRVIATRRRGDPDAIPWIVQAQDVEVVESRRLKADGASGGRAVRSKAAPDRAGVRCLATTCPPPARKVKGSDPAEATGSHEAAGTYRVFGRIRKVVEDAQAEVWLTYGDGMKASRPVRIERGPALDWWYYDLGRMQVNGGGGPVAHDQRSEGGFPVAPLPFSLHVRDMDDQPGGIEIDHLGLLPADTEMCRVLTNPTGVPARLVLDGNNNAAYRLNAAGALLPDGGAHYIGGLPQLSTHSPTRVFVLSGIHGGAASTVDGSTEVTVEHHCRHFDVPPFTDGAAEPVLS